jgi:two-component system chemotaxis sensor kinase CheA
VFRGLHTLKGSGAMFGFDALATFTHHCETAFDRVRKGEVAATPTWSRRFWPPAITCAADRGSDGRATKPGRRVLLADLERRSTAPTGSPPSPDPRGRRRRPGACAFDLPPESLRTAPIR